MRPIALDARATRYQRVESFIDATMARGKAASSMRGRGLTAADVARKERLETIEGVVPRPTDLPPGCHFAPRCRHRMPRCTAEEIPLYQLEGGVEVRCVLYDLAAAVASDASVSKEKR